MAFQFRDRQRVRIIDHGSRPELNGMTGTVVRCLMLTQEAAWIHVDGELPEHCRSFPKEDRRGNHTKVYSDEVEELQ